MTPETIQRFAGSLLHFIWQGAAIALIASIGLRMLHRRSAELRYAVSVAALVAMLAAPVLTFVFYVETGAFALKLLQFTGKTLVDAAPAASLPQAAATAAWTQWILATWSIGVFAFTARLVAGWRLSHRLVQESDTVVPASILYVFEQLKDRLEVSRPIQLLINAQIDTPMVVGCLRPAVLVPLSALTGLTPEQLTAILAHELAHIRRHDFFVNILQRCVESLLFYHPGVWWLSARIRTEREHCCDDIAVRLCGDRRTYVQALVELERKRQTAPALSVAATGGNLVQRAQRILGLQTSHADWQSAAATLAIVLVWLVVGAWQSSSTLQAKPVLPSTPAPVAAAVLTPMASPEPVAESLSAIAAILTAQPGTPAAYAVQDRSRLAGVVLEYGSDRPLAGVRVAFSTRSESSLTVSSARLGSSSAATNDVEAITDGEGRFAVDLSPGRYLASPRLNGFVYFRAAGLQTGRDPGVWVQLSGRQDQDIEVRMAREGAISGELWDIDGQPAGPPRVVYLLRYTFDEYGVRSLQTVGPPIPVDDRGRYRFFGLQPGEYHLRSPGAPPMGKYLTTYYPGTSDEAKAVAIRVGIGEEVKVSPVILQKAVEQAEVRLLFSETEGGRPRSRSIRFFDRATGVTRIDRAAPLTGPDEFILQEMVSGAYDLIVSWTVSGQLFYRSLRLDVRDFNIRVGEIAGKRGIKVTGAVIVEDATGRRPAGPEIGCRLRLAPGNTLAWNAPCAGGQFVDGLYHIELVSIPADSYVMSAEASGRDFLAQGLQLEEDTEVEIVLGSPGGSILGTVQNANGERIRDAVVVLVPDAPFRAAGVLYRTASSDVNGRFELRGIRPGSYRLFAWSELEGAAYRNAEFLERFEDHGKPVAVKRGDRVSMDVLVMEGAQR